MAKSILANRTTPRSTTSRKPALKLVHSQRETAQATDIYGRPLILRGSMARDYCLAQLLEG